MGKFNYFLYKDKRLEKLSPQQQEDIVFDLVNAFALTRTPFDTALLVYDLLTEKEVRNLAKRLRIAKLLLSGRTIEEIVREVHCSATTASKVNIWLANSGEGLRNVIQKLPKRKTVYKPKRTPGIGYGLPQIIAYYASSYLEKKERARLQEFLASMRAKTATDKDLREEADASFRDRKPKKR